MAIHMKNLLPGCGVMLVLMVVSRATLAEDDVQPSAKWWKGNIHTHTLWSDGNDFPEMVAKWYKDHGYHFLSLSDHNILSQGQKWMPAKQVSSRSGGAAMKKYLEAYGPNWVQQSGEPGTDAHQVRLQPLSEFRTLLEAPGEFLMIQGEEISDRVDGKPVHMNATNVQELLRPMGGETVRDAIANNLRAAQEQAKKTGKTIMVHLNHPNFGYAVTAEDIAAVIPEKFFEVFNGHPSVNHHGNDSTPGVERLWDIANTIRIAKYSAAPLFGLATDDSHSYHGRKGARPGRGWIMVRSHFLTPRHLLEAIDSGNFYSSSGVSLGEVRFDSDKQQLIVDIQAKEGVAYKTEFIGTLVGYETTEADESDPEKESDAGDEPVKTDEPTKTDEPAKTDDSDTDAEVDNPPKYSSEIGKVLFVAEGPHATYQLTGKELYVRAVVTSSEAPVDPVFRDQLQQAWTQAFGWQKHVTK